MAAPGTYSRKEKAKGIAFSASPVDDVPECGSPIQEFVGLIRPGSVAERESETSGSSRPDNESRRGDEAGSSSRSDNESQRGDEAGSSSRSASEETVSLPPSPQTLWLRHRMVRFELIDCRPTVYRLDGVFEELPALSPELLRDPWAEGQHWANVFGTQSSHCSVRGLLERYKGLGVTYIVPSPEQRPWSPPVGYQCIYESLFEDDSKLWFPIPRLITSYVRRRGVAISQLKIGSIRNAIMLMVMAAEIDVPMSVRVFEELTSTKAEKAGMFSVKMRPSYNVLSGQPTKTKNWQRSYFYIKADEHSFAEALEDDFPVLWNPKIGR